MMSRVLVTAINGSNITCSDGSIRSAIGMGRVCVGDALWGNGDFVLSPGGAPASRPPIVWEEVTLTHFADNVNLKMHYIDKNFSKIIKSVNIVQPENSAFLLLHCYNKTAEFLVWYWDAASEGGHCRILIQKNGSTIADFTSVFPSLTYRSVDGYIDASGCLIWVAFVDTSPDYSSVSGVFCKYSNGEVQSTVNIASPNSEMSNLRAGNYSTANQITGYTSLISRQIWGTTPFDARWGPPQVPPRGYMTFEKQAVVQMDGEMAISDVFLWDMTCHIMIMPGSAFFDFYCRGSYAGRCVSGSNLVIDAITTAAIVREDSQSIMHPGTFEPQPNGTVELDYEELNPEIITDENGFEYYEVIHYKETYEIIVAAQPFYSRSVTSVSHRTDLGGGYELVMKTPTDAEFGTIDTRAIIKRYETVIIDAANRPDGKFYTQAWMQKGSTLQGLASTDTDKMLVIESAGGAATEKDCLITELLSVATTRYV